MGPKRPSSSSNATPTPNKAPATEGTQGDRGRGHAGHAGPPLTGQAGDQQGTLQPQRGVRQPNDLGPPRTLTTTKTQQSEHLPRAPSAGSGSNSPVSPRIGSSPSPDTNRPCLTRQEGRGSGYGGSQTPSTQKSTTGGLTRSPGQGGNPLLTPELAAAHQDALRIGRLAAYQSSLNAVNLASLIIEHLSNLIISSSTIESTTIFPPQNGAYKGRAMERALLVQPQCV